MAVFPSSAPLGASPSPSSSFRRLRWVSRLFKARGIASKNPHFHAPMLIIFRTFAAKTIQHEARNTTRRRRQPQYPRHGEDGDAADLRQDYLHCLPLRSLHATPRGPARRGTARHELPQRHQQRQRRPLLATRDQAPAASDRRGAVHRLRRHRTGGDRTQRRRRRLHRQTVQQPEAYPDALRRLRQDP